MKFYGNVNLQENELQQAVVQIEEDFPVDAKVGRLAFVNSILYICVSVADDLPVWVPLTKELTLFTFSQATAATEWTIEHGLNTTGVQIQVFDAQGRVVIPEQITVVGPNTATVSFGGAPFAGRAVVLTGHTDGNVKPTYSYTHFQTVAASSWVILHGLGYNPIARVFVGNSEVQPASIVHDSVNQMTITFNRAYAGVAKLV
jgi:hypothetical protein